MNKWYKREIIERFMSEKELLIFNEQYRLACLPRPYSRWGTDQDRKDYIKTVKKLNNAI